MKRLIPGCALLIAALAASVAHGATQSVQKELESARAPVRQLAFAGSTVSSSARFWRYRQRIAGIPVLGSSLVVTDAPGDAGDLVIDHTRAGLRAPGKATVSRSEAITIARSRLHVSSLRAAPRATLAILPQSTHDLLVWRVLLPAASPLGSFEVLVGAQTKAIVRIRDRLRTAPDQAAIFDPNPVEANGGPSGLADNDDADSDLLTRLRTLVPLQRLNPGNCLDGRWVKAVLPGGPVCLAGRDFTSVTRHDDRFEALMAYFHIDRTRAYIQSLGFTDVVNRQLQVNADSDFGTGNDDNSFFDPTTGQISLGPGGVDDAEDADVIVHEYGHAVQDSQSRGFGEGQEAGAIGEGWGDYLAADMSATYSPNPTFDPCIAEWDFIGRGCLRSVNTNQTVAQLRGPPCFGEIHCLGQAWSSALWAIRGALGGPAADRLILESNYSLPPSASFQDASRALLAADRDPKLYGGANQALLRGVLSNLGLLDLARIDDTPDGATPLSVPGQGTGDLDSSSDLHDLYSVDLAPGRGLIVKLTGAGDFDLRLYAPGLTSVYTGTTLAGSTTGGTSTESFSYVPPGTGTATSTYYVDVSAMSGSGSYTVQTISDLDGDGLADGSDNCPSAANRDQKDSDGDRIGDACDKFPRDAANDVDRDGIGANADNCPKAANKNQRDWNQNGRGDACDRGSRITISAVSVRGHRVTLVGSLRPIAVDKADWNVFVQRGGACAGTCRFARAARQQGARKLSSGRIRFTFVLARAGRYRIYATLADPRFKRSRSRFATIQIGRG